MVPDHLPIRLVRLFAGLFLFGGALALMVRARLGLGPWDVFHQGVADRAGVAIGWIVIATSIAVLLLWIPLHQRPGIGTVANALTVGLSANVGLAIFPSPGGLALRIAFLVIGVVATGAATGLYIGAGLGPGPRDGVMTGLAARGMSIRLARTLIEATILLIGWLLGGSVGPGTLLFAATIGPLAHFFIPKLTFLPAPMGEGT